MQIKNTYKVSLLLGIMMTIFQSGFSQKPEGLNIPDVLDYNLSLEVNFSEKQIKGNVTINFSLPLSTNTVIFNSGKLSILKVTGKQVTGFQQKGKNVHITLSDRTEKMTQVKISYEGKPTQGLVFLSEKSEAYTVFSTEEWMVCNNSPSDRAKLDISLTIPADKSGIASGTFIQKETIGSQTKHTWKQDYESPAYTFGFAIGDFNETQEQNKDVSLHYYAAKHKREDLITIFNKTADMMNFFETKSGIKYIQNSYSQIIMGNHYQEMSGFSVLKNTYGGLVLKDSTETNLISHELAHQWWGNMITCESWSHFWLNEGFATFMSAAYNEHRFGKEKYEADINSYSEVYRKVKEKGLDKPLVFPSWNSPTREDRNLVYFKGAYVLHLLRKEMGEADFWKGIKSYSKQYFGKSVNTLQFQETMESSTGRDLKSFFDQWIY